MYCGGSIQFDTPGFVVKQSELHLAFFAAVCYSLGNGGEFSSPFPVYKRFILPNGYRKVKAFFVNICGFRRCFFVRFDGFCRGLQ